MKRITPLLLTIAITTPALSQSNGEDDDNLYSFTTILKNPITSIKDQNKSGTCWDYATLGFFESEILRTSGKEVDLCEMYIAHKDYEDCADFNVRMHGDSRFSEGGSCFDALSIIKRFGVVPEEAMPKAGSLVGDTLANFNEFWKVIEPYEQAIAKGKQKKISKAWKSGLIGILDAYLGKCPTDFTYQGKHFTPKSFAESLGLNWDNYTSFTSFTHHPFYTEFNIEVPYKWRPSLTKNIRLAEMMDIIDKALEKGYNVAWGGDVTDKNFSRKGIATDSITPTQESRQKRFDNWDATYDHVMLIYGTAKDQDGKQYYLVKNSWGNYGDYKGTWYMSKDYIANNTTYIFLNREAVPEYIEKKF